MAEVTYKKITELDSASLPLDGANEYALVSQSGVSKKALWSGIFGGGWWTKLKAAFDDFVAPEALHATDADTLGGEAASYYTDASNLTSGALPLERIPAELTGKNAATATLAASAAKLATARTIGGVSFDGTANINLPGVNTTGNQNTSGNAATATLAATATNALACSGNAATATVADSCSGNSATATQAANASTLSGYGVNTSPVASTVVVRDGNKVLYGYYGMTLRIHGTYTQNNIYDSFAAYLADEQHIACFGAIGSLRISSVYIDSSGETKYVRFYGVDSGGNATYQDCFNGVELTVNISVVI